MTIGTPPVRSTDRLLPPTLAAAVLLSGCAVGPVTKSTWGLGALGAGAGLLIAASGGDDCDDPCDDDDGEAVKAGLIVGGASLAAAAAFTPVAMTIDRGLYEADLVSHEDCDKIRTSEWKAMLGASEDEERRGVADVLSLKARGLKDSDYVPYEDGATQ